MSEPTTEPPDFPESKSKRRRPFFRPRFGLKAFFVFVMLTGLFFGFIYPFVRRARTESEAISKLKSLYPIDFYKPRIFYDYEVDADDATSASKLEPSTPKWVRMILGEHCFSTVNAVRLVGGVNDNVKSFEDVEPLLAKFKNIEILAVDGLGYRKDTDFFEAYPDLRVLSLSSWSGLEDLEGLADLHELESLNLSMTNIRSISPVANCSRMKQLSLTGCESLVDIEPIAGMSELTTLDQTYCSKVKSLDYLVRFEKLEQFACSSSDHVKSFDFALIAKNKNLKTLSLTGFESFESIELLSEFQELDFLRLDCCQGFERLPSLAGLIKLRTVVLQNCDSLKSLEGIEDSGTIATLSLSRCGGLQDIEAVSEMVSVKTLRVEGCDLLADYQPISRLKFLESINLQGISVKNLDMLKGLDLSDVTIWNCPNLADIGGLSELGEHACVTIQACPKVTEEMTFAIEDSTGINVLLH